jgi:deazaflavin-dependent oxidoreductase (nitroreductase family)
MPLPRWLARLNRVGLNRGVRLVAGHLPGLGLVLHEGRRSRRQYRTPVNVFRHDGGFAIALTYGPDSDWVANVVHAQRAKIVRGGHTYAVVRPQVIEDPERKPAPAPVRAVLRLLDVDRFLLVDVESGEQAE